MFVLVKVSAAHFMGLSENQATLASGTGEREICNQKDSSIPPVAGF